MEVLLDDGCYKKSTMNNSGSNSIRIEVVYLNILGFQRLLYIK